MKRILVVCCLLVLGWCMNSRADVLFDDEFDGTSINSSIWSYASPYMSVSGGKLVFDTSGSNGFQEIESDFYAYNYIPVDGVSYGRATFDTLDGGILWNMTIGLTGEVNVYRIWLRTDIGNGMWTVEIADDGVWSRYATDVDRSNGGTWIIEWYDNKILAYHDGVVKFNSSINAPQSGNTTWLYPSEPLRPAAGGSGGSIMTVEGIKWESINLVSTTEMVNDHFEGLAGSTPDTNVWGFTSGVTLDGASKVVFDTSVLGFQQLVGTITGPSSQAYVPTAGEDYGTVVFENLGGGILWNMALGLTGYGSDRIWLRTDIGDGMWNVDIAGQGYFQTDVPRNSGTGTWIIEWFSNSVKIYHNGILKYDSKVNQPAITIPTGVMRPDIGGAGGQIMTLDRIIWKSTTLAEFATNPSPADGARKIPLSATLSWMPGFAAANTNGHKLYISQDAQLVANRAVAPIILSSSQYTPTGGFDKFTTYYWCVDEVNDVNPASPWEGQIWSFDTVVSGTIIMDEHFDGDINTQPDANSWDYNTDPNKESMDGGSNLVFHGAPTSLLSRSWGPYSQMYYPVANQNFGRLTLFLGGSVPWNTLIGLAGYEANNIYLRTDYGDGLWNVCISNQRYPLNIGCRGSAAGVWTIEWFTDRVRVFFNGELQFDTANITDVTFTIPTADMRPIINIYGGAETMTLDRLVWEKVESVCISEESSAADLNGDCLVNVFDLHEMVTDWLTTDGLLAASTPNSAGLVASYQLELDATDSASYTGGPFDGTIEGSPVWVSGQVGDYALEFDGVNDYINCGTFNPSASTGKLTVAFWTYWKGANDTFQAMVSKRNSWGAADMMWCIATGDYGNNPSIKIFNTSKWVVLDDYELPVNQWTHIALTHDGNNVTFYVNGLKMGEPQEFAFDPGTSAAVCIGASQLGGAESFNGRLDDVRMYDYALTPAQIAYVYLNGPGSVYLPIESKANIYNSEPQGSRSINLRDLAVMAEDWLQNFAWPN